MSETKNNVSSGFLLGAASSSYQVEGGNIHSDWWQAGEEGKVPKAGQASDYWNRFKTDHELAQRIGLNALRVSIEWSRVESEPGKFDEAAIAHYREVFTDIKNRGMQLFVTLHHFSLPNWAADKGGFFCSAVRDSFEGFSLRMLKEFRDVVDGWVTINEPEVYATMGYALGLWPPFRKNRLSWLRMQRMLGVIHRRVYRAMKSAYPKAVVGIVKNLHYYAPANPKNVFDRFLAQSAHYFGNELGVNSIYRHTDFLGVNYYFSHQLRFPLRGLDIRTNQEPKTDMNWPIYAEGLYKVLASLRRFQLPVYVTENGLADAADSHRKNYIRDHLTAVKKAASEGIDIRGYFYWSLTDNYEWADGFGPRFGLIEIDYETQERKIRESAKVFKEFA